MVPIFGTVQMLKPGKSTFGLELRLIHCYENTNAFSMECIFHDREGVRIHVTILKASVDKFKHRLIEGNVYALIDFVVGINVMKYKTTGRLYKIIVFNQTRIFEVFHAEFMQQPYEIKTFNDIANMQNIGDAAMFVTLWEIYVEEMIKFLETKLEGPVAVIVQFCRPNMYRGEVRVLSLFNITKILLNQNDPELADFNFRYLTTRKVRSTSISTLTSSSKRSLNDEIRDGDFELKTISEVMTDEKGRTYEGIPAGLEHLSNRKTLFNIFVQPGQTKNYTGSYSVARICIDREIIKKVCGEEIGTEDEESISINGSEIIDDMSGEFIVYATVNSIEDIFGISYLACKVNNNKVPFDVVKVVVEDSTISEKQGTSSKSKKGKEIVDENSDQLNIREALLTPKKMNTTNSDAGNIMGDDHVKRNLLDEFSATTNKRIKRAVKKEKQ
ncbi:hypothetical protein C2S52_016056 [Perilla frutescens var. hirtella]|nr:hypothetical protein C2S52_016056 [Perilla frutescens var. hirtella]